MHCATVCCSVLQCVVVVVSEYGGGRVEMCCSGMQYVTMCCSMPQCVAVSYGVLQYVAVCCSVLQCVAVCFDGRECVQWQVCCSVL